MFNYEATLLLHIINFRTTDTPDRRFIIKPLVHMSSLGEMVNTTDLKSVPFRVIGSIPIVSKISNNYIPAR